MPPRINEKEAQEITSQVVHKLQEEQNILGFSHAYGLDQFFELSEINQKLFKAPKFKRGPIEISLYPLENAMSN